MIARQAPAARSTAHTRSSPPCFQQGAASCWASTDSASAHAVCTPSENFDFVVSPSPGRPLIFADFAAFR
eukprot:3586921-Prymnesium_polylepis.1